MTKLRNTFLSLSIALATSLTFLQPATADVEAKATKEITAAPTIVAEASSKLSYEKPFVSSTPAPKIEAPVVAVQSSQPEAVTTATKAAPVAKKTETYTAPSQTPALTVQTPVVASSGNGAALLAAAYAQIGITQDCTRMVENALGSIGIVTGDLGPAQFSRFGTVVGNPAPGDILISAGHVGIYAGNGQMVSGGFNGNQTVLHPVSYVGGFTAIRV